MKRRFGPALTLAALLAILVSGRIAASDPAKKKYVFHEDTDRWVAVERGEWHLVGKLDRNGDFVEEFMWKKGQGKSLTTTTTLNPAIYAWKPQNIYEFRSGMLIPGALQPDGRFVPEAGGKIIPFKDYEYSPTATPIWNLPGVFITEAQAAELKKGKPVEKK
jgi:hypothetical protein